MNLDNLKNEYHIIKTEEDYERYKLTENGISPRGIPGFGKGFVAVDSDEHDEMGRITEDHEIRNKAVSKRKEKLNQIKKEIIPPVFIGEEDYEGLIVGWGSTYNIIFEALENLKENKLSFLHFRQVYPLHPLIKQYLAKAKFTIVIENNVTGQFSNLIQREFCKKVDYRVLKYDGLPFAVEEIETEIRDILKKEEIL